MRCDDLSQFYGLLNSSNSSNYSSYSPGYQIDSTHCLPCLRSRCGPRRVYAPPFHAPSKCRPVHWRNHARYGGLLSRYRDTHVDHSRPQAPTRLPGTCSTLRASGRSREYVPLHAMERPWASRKPGRLVRRSLRLPPCRPTSHSSSPLTTTRCRPH